MRDGCPKAEDILHVLRDRVALLPGARDRNGRAVIIFPARENTTPINPDHIRNILIYLHAVTALVLAEIFEKFFRIKIS
ncbi:unnamed protein product [Brugia timori]|uniref:Uncharacterized protein n=1 Tax=Brugia timori TaxID=42155 RepID=A0A0R3Q7U1_9BILA|nr:unnamed protein product [Brugia timori]